MNRFAVYITYKELTGQQPTENQLIDLLRPYRRRDVLLLLAKLNAVLKHWRNNLDVALDRKLVRELFPDTPDLLKLYYKKGPERLLFSRVALLYVIKQASRFCSDTGRQVNSLRDARQIALCCLMAGDLFQAKAPEGSELLDFLSSVMPHSDYVSRDTYVVDIGRNLYIFEEIVNDPTVSTGGSLGNLRSEFKRTVGLDFREFVEFVLCAVAPYLSIKYEVLIKEPGNIVLQPDFFSKTKARTNQLQTFWRVISIADSDLPNQMRSAENRPSRDFTVLQDKPVIALGGGAYLCIDPGFLLDKAGRGLFWTMFSAMPSDQKEELAARWGMVFELYVNRLLGSEYQGDGEFVANPIFENGDQAFDGYLREGSSLCVIETKSSIIRADAKYGFDTQLLRSQLEGKFISGSPDERKGVSQLETSMRRVLSGEQIRGLDMKGVRKIYPILLGLDPSLATLGMSKYVGANFPARDLRKRYKRMVTPLATLVVSDVELLLPYTEACRFSDILESKYRATGQMPGQIHPKGVPLLKDLRTAKEGVQERFRDLLLDIKGSLFEPTTT